MKTASWWLSLVVSGMTVRLCFCGASGGSTLFTLENPYIMEILRCLIICVDMGIPFFGCAVRFNPLVYNFISGMVQANVGHKVTLITLSKGYFCTNFYIRWSRDVTSQSTTTQRTNKHHHHGDGAARPSSGVDLMIPHQPRGRRPCACSFQGRC
jgi:hypothetical protein